VTAYPVPPEQAGLRSISRLAQRFAATVGYSDHTRGIDAAVLSVAQGARIVEKHFTLAHDFSPFRDHQISAEPAELAELVRRIRAAEAMLGDGIKRVQPAEQDAVISARRSIAAGRDLPRGHRIEWGDLTWLRPGGGMPPGQENLLVGRSLKRAVAFGEPFAASDVEPPG
jgi:sialic acid synthase SpsE